MDTNIEEVEEQISDNGEGTTVSNINNKRPEYKEDKNATQNPILAPYHRSMEEIEKMPVIEKTMTVCPECKLIIQGIIYKDGENVMIRKNCPEHGWFIEKYGKIMICICRCAATTTMAEASTTKCHF